MSFKKKLIMLCVLVLTLTLCCFGLAACGENDNSSTPIFNVEKNDEDRWEITGLTIYGSTLSQIVIPESLNGKTITGIGGSAFKGCTSLKSVVIGSGVTWIGSGAFYDCTSLTNVTIGSGVTWIGSYAFGGCSNLNKVNYTGTIDQWVQIRFSDLRSNPIYYTGNLYINDVLLTEANITTATKINDYAFWNCYSLTSVTIGSGITSIGEDAFAGCCKLIEVINKSELNITKGSGVGERALKVKSSGESEIVNQNGYLFYTADGKNYLVGYVGEETALTLPKNYNGQNYEINKYAFCECTSLTSIVLPDSVTSIGNSAFYGCSSLQYNEYGNAYYLGNESNPYLCLIKAKSTNITTCTINDNCKFIYRDAFWNCYSLTSVTISDSVTSIGEDAFYGCSSLKKVNYTGTVDQWVQISFGYGSSNPTYYAKDLYINDVLLREANITTATRINSYAFCSCTSLTSVTIGNGVTSIGERAFYGCSSLTSVTIPDSVTSIGSGAFAYCISLESVTFENTEGWFVSWDSDATSGTDVTVTDATQNAVYLTDTYVYDYWKRK